MDVLYPAIEPYKHGYLHVGDGHEIYWEECGNPSGIPVLFIHGGPGAGCRPNDRRIFNPSYFRIILFDQRGCGRSRPAFSLEANTTGHLVEDIEKIRGHLQVDKWIIFGGSWGSTLGLVYAIKYPDACTSLVLRGIFLGRERDINWYFSGTRQTYPDYWENLNKFLPDEERGNLLEAYYKRVTNINEEISAPAAESFCRFEFSCANLIPNSALMDMLKDKSFVLGFARMECHFFKHNCFLPDEYILENLSRIAHLPITIIHGRYDILCPLAHAYDLALLLPHSDLQIIEASGHSFSETAIRKALVSAMDKISGVI